MTKLPGLLGAAVLAATLLAPAAQAETRPTGKVPAIGALTPAVGAYVDIDLTGWTTYAGFGNAMNSQVFLAVGAGTQVLGFEYSNLSITTSNGSWLDELVISLNTSDGFEYMDWTPSLISDAGSESGLSGSWNGPNGQPGPFGEGASFAALGDGILWVTVYEAFNDGGDALDATITSGTLRIFLSPVPEPGTYGLMALGLFGIGAFVRRRQSR